MIGENICYEIAHAVKSTAAQLGHPKSSRSGSLPSSTAAGTTPLNPFSDHFKSSQHLKCTIEVVLWEVDRRPRGDGSHEG